MQWQAIDHRVCQSAFAPLSAPPPPHLQTCQKQQAAPAPPIRRSFDSAARRRSTERNLSQRRYDDHWGAAEGADCRAKCADGRILHIHSQLLSLASPVLRDMLTLLLPQQQVEARDGPAYLLALDDDSAALAAALDMVYPTAHLAPPTWVRCVAVAAVSLLAS